MGAAHAPIPQRSTVATSTVASAVTTSAAAAARQLAWLNGGQRPLAAHAVRAYTLLGATGTLCGRPRSRVRLLGAINLVY